MDAIKIKLDYSHGPIWKDKFDSKTGQWRTGIKKVDEDKALQVLNDEAESIYTSLYSFDADGVPCSFDTVRFEAVKGELLSMVETILLRLKEINNGDFEIIDEETDRLSEIKRAV